MGLIGVCGELGRPFFSLFTLAIFVTLPQSVRLERLRLRERRRYGKRIEPGGDRYTASQAFLDWAALYDTAGPKTRSLAMHGAWLKRLDCPILPLQSLKPVDVLVDNILAELGQH